MSPARSVKLLLAALLCACLLASACVVNPATGKRELSLVTEGQEIQLGRENDRAIVAQMGLYEDDSLQRYVHELGLRMARRSERPELEWTFRVIDDPVVNAFALPGGYIYITRGILAHMKNEAELAAVVGHEIGHVTARHSASQISKAQLAQLGFGLGSIFAPDATEKFGGVLETGVGVAFLKFGRDDEREADDLGLRYMVAGGYDARPMADMFDMLDRVGGSSGGGPPAWMSTHPAPENRRARAEARIAALNYDPSKGVVNERGFLERIEGLTFGQDPRQGYFEAELFLHPDMRFRMQFPEGWQMQNMRQAVVGISPESDATVQLTLSGQPTPEAAMSEFFEKTGATRVGPAMGSISGMRTAGDGFTVETEQGKLKGRVGFVSYGDRVFQLLAYTAEYRWTTYESTIRSSLASFDRLTDSRALNVQPQRIKIVQADRAMTIEELSARHGSTVAADTLRLINRLDPGERLVAGRSYKVVTGGK